MLDEYLLNNTPCLQWCSTAHNSLFYNYNSSALQMMKHDLMYGLFFIHTSIHMAANVPNEVAPVTASFELTDILLIVTLLQCHFQ